MRKPPLALVALLLALAGVAALGCSARERAFDGERAYRDVVAQCDLGPRLPGSEASRQAQDYFVEQLRQAGWTVEEQRWTHEGVALMNVVAKAGQGPLVVLGAHYDSRAQADRDARDTQAPVPGANDGASGAAVLLELARTVDPSRLHQEVWLAFWDAEDQGGIGGWPWSVGARHMAEALERPPELVLVADMVGDAQQELFWERSSTPWLNERLWSLAADLGFGAHFVPAQKHSIIDDHTPFLERGIPAADIIDFDYPYWHTTADTPDKVSAASLERVGRVLQRFLTGAAQVAPAQ